MDDGQIEIVILQMNDVYEIAPLSADDFGGLARVATLKNELEAGNENTLFVLAGDFLSPSIYNTVKDSMGNSFGGKQMIACLNEAGLDLAIFGNHEFDLNQKQLQECIDESEFDWVSSNIFQLSGSELVPFAKVRGDQKTEIPQTRLITFEDEDGTTLRLGIMSLTMNPKKPEYVAYDDAIDTAVEMVKRLQKDTVDLILPITHLSYDTDVKLANALDSIPLILGGHEHFCMLRTVGNTTIAKADANAKTVYIHKINFNKKTDSLSVSSQLIPINKDIVPNAEVQKLVEYWKNLAEGHLVKEGFSPDNVVVELKTELDGLESSMRNSQQELGQIITGAMCAASRNYPDIALTNSGAVRVDDKLIGKLKEYDIFRILPYEDEIWEVEMMGFLLNQILKAGEDAVDNGAYIQRKCVEYSSVDGLFRIQGQAIQDSAVYKVAMSKYMLKGEDYPFLTADTKGILDIAKPDSLDRNDLRQDIRKALMAYFPEYIAAKNNPNAAGSEETDCLMCK